MNLRKTYIKYLAYRALSIAFIVLGVNFILLDGEYVRASIFLILGVFLTVKYSTISPFPKEAKCLEKRSPLVSMSISFILVISLGVTVLALFRYFSNQEELLGVLTLSSLVFLLMGTLYRYLCKKDIS